MKRALRKRVHTTTRGGKLTNGRNNFLAYGVAFDAREMPGHTLRLDKNYSKMWWNNL